MAHRKDGKRRQKKRGSSAGPPGGAPKARSLSRELLRAALVIAILAIAVRVAYIAEVHDHPLMTTTTGDSRVYDLRALEIADGDWLGADVFFHSSPVYPYILGLIYAAFGHSYVAARVVQLLFGVASCLLIFSIARALFGPREGLIAGIIAALYAPFIFFDSELLMITYVVFFALLAIRLLMAYRERPRAWVIFAGGIATGVSALGKPNVLVFVPAALFWLWWSFRGCQKPGGAARAMALLVAGTIIALAPITISNYLVARDLVVTSSNGGINFWIGNNDQADGTFLVKQAMRADLYAGSKQAAEHALGRALKPSEVSSYWFRKGLQFIRANPGQELRLLGRKLLLFWNAYEIPNHYNLNYFKTVSNVLRYNPFLFSWVIPIGFLGIYVSRSHWRKYLLLYLFGGAYLLSLMPFFVTSRYRLPIVPVMMVFCAHGIWWLWRRISNRERKGWFAPMALLGVALVVVNLEIVDFTFGHQYAIVGAVYRDSGDYEKAAEYFRLAIEESPEYDLAYNNLGSVLSRLGRHDEAERMLIKALQINPHLASAHSNVGLVYLRAGRFEQARESLVRATQENPQLKSAWDNLGRLGIMTRDNQLAVTSLEHVLRLDPGDAYAHWNLAVLYSGDPDRARESIDHARRAGALEPALRAEAGELINGLSAELRARGE